MGKQSNFAPRTFLETTCFLSQSLCKVSIDIVCDFFVGNGVFHNHCLVCHHVNTIGKRCEIKILKRSCSNNKDGAHCRKIHKSRREVTRVVFFCGDNYLQSPYDTRKSAFHCLVVYLFFRISLFIHVKWVNNITYGFCQLERYIKRTANFSLNGKVWRSRDSVLALAV